MVFTAGNHDTLLDGECYDSRWARQQLTALPPNVTYLENDGVTVLGVRLWGTPPLSCAALRCAIVPLR